ncbi:MAG: hypothetical protein H8E14_13320 [Candidatus Marinimicrobia bacterium]|nr:hypothetical protein [Candidatus Neomarinimicrobiota bacterium]MBC8402463.1 hypothetical protein [Candidatus Neomarinimicrobiota bacterium]
MVSIKNSKGKESSINIRQYLGTALVYVLAICFGALVLSLLIYFGNKIFEFSPHEELHTGADTTYFDNGKIDYVGNWLGDKRVGEWSFWYENGQKKSEGVMENNLMVGKWIYWYENGQKETEGFYIESNPNGIWTYYNKDGTVREIKDYGQNE